MLSTSKPHWIERLRLGVVLLAAASVSLPMAWISLAKILLFVFGLVYLIACLLDKSHTSALRSLWTTRLVLVIVMVFALSLLWTEVDHAFALLAFVKHSKLLEILLLVFLIRSQREARIAITTFATCQVFVLLSSWLLATGMPLPWVLNSQEILGTKYVVFAESYLDQSIMLATTAAIVWHLCMENYWPRWFAGLIAISALLNVFLLLPGRTGYLVALALLALAVLWGINNRLRFWALVAIPLIVMCGLYFSSGRLHERVFEVVHETQNFSEQVETKSSSGWRLNAWVRSIQAVHEKPWAGFGVGSWAPAVKRLEGDTATKVFGKTDSSNPHQEFLLWGVETGVGGVALLLALLISVVKDAQQFPVGVRRATLSVATTIAIACLFNSALFDDLMGDFLCISLGLMMALGVHSPPSRKPISAS